MVDELIHKRTVIGLIEEVEIISNGSSKKVFGKIDTGATKSSIDRTLAQELKLGPIIKQKNVKSAQGNEIRPIVIVKVIISGREISTEFTIADRSQLKYPVLVGQNILKHDFLIDPLQ